MSGNDPVSTVATIGNITSIISDIATTAGAVGGLVLAWRWLQRRDLEKAHDAANCFFDELHQLLPRTLDFMLSVAGSMAFMASIENDTAFPGKKHEAERQCLELVNRINQIKLLFFARYALAARRGISVRPEAHKRLESALICFSDTASIRLQYLASRLVSVTEHDDYILVVGAFRLSFGEIQLLSDDMNAAFSHVIDIDYRDYFDFPVMSPWIKSAFGSKNLRSRELL